jgi:hypothetical protein
LRVTIQPVPRLLAGSQALKWEHVSKPRQMLTGSRSASHNRIDANPAKNGTNFWRRPTAPSWGMPGSNFK